jgi:hypothetical protein
MSSSRLEAATSKTEKEWENAGEFSSLALG